MNDHHVTMVTCCNNIHASIIFADQAIVTIKAHVVLLCIQLSAPEIISVLYQTASMHS